MHKKDKKIVPIILAGGIGKRLWPMSRTSRPKQFIPLFNEYSPFQQTLLRLKDNAQYTNPVIITNKDYRFLVAEQALECGVEPQAILLKPIARNTAPAITVACFYICKNSEQNLVHIFPSDQEMIIDEAYNNALENAIKSANNGRLVTFGIPPTRACTGFGYIKQGENDQAGAYKIANFIEKPNKETAQKMLAQGDYYWNSGMFLFLADKFLVECKNIAPKIYETAKLALEDAKKDLDFIRIDEEKFTLAPNISIDYAIFEKTKLASIIPCPITWSDLGSWSAIWRTGKRDENENLQLGNANLINTKNSLIISNNTHIVVNGFDDIAVIASDDAIYIGHLTDSQSVSQIVTQLNNNEKTISLTKDNKTTYRPWGSYCSTLNGKQFQVKRLTIKPAKRLSLQKHKFRCEHWIVVNGIAQVELDDKTQIIHENESLYIPKGTKHRLTNIGKIPLEIIEVQTGSYFGEDDIIRYEDDYNRLEQE